MGALYAIAGAIVGALAAVASCLVASRFVRGYTDEAPAMPLPSWRALLPAAVGMALLGAYVGWDRQSPGVIALSLGPTALCFAVALIDLQVRRIPNVLVLVLVALAVVQGLALGWPSVGGAALGALVGGGAFAGLYVLGRGAMGAGDVKFVAATGLLVGYPLILRAMLWGILLGGAAALLLLVSRRVGRKDPMAYGPYLALGAWVVWVTTLLG